MQERDSPNSRKALPEQMVTAHDKALPRRPKKGALPVVIAAIVSVVAAESESMVVKLILELIGPWLLI